MTTATQQYAQQGFLIGQTRISEEGLEGYSGRTYREFIPKEDVLDKLFCWEPVSLGVTYSGHLADGTPIEFPDPSRQVMFRPPLTFGPEDTGGRLGEFGVSSYNNHSYKEWCVENVFRIIDDENVGISSAAQLASGKVAAVTISVPNTVTSKTGVAFLPYIIAATSLDGTIASTYKASYILPVCRNTLVAGLRSDAASFKLKHTKNSDVEVRIADVQEALGLIYASGDEFSAQIDKLVETTVTAKKADKFFDQFAPVKDNKQKTQMEAKNLLLRRMYESDYRVAPWNGTTFGVLQAVNTWFHHEQPTRKGNDRVERNILRDVNGKTAELDQKVLTMLGVK